LTTEKLRQSGATHTIIDVVNVVDGLLISLVSGLGGTTTSTVGGVVGVPA
jgi:hypothetical protein